MEGELRPPRAYIDLWVHFASFCSTVGWFADHSVRRSRHLARTPRLCFAGQEFSGGDLRKSALQKMLYHSSKWQAVVDGTSHFPPHCLFVNVSTGHFRQVSENV